MIKLKPLLTEGKYDKFVTDLSREIIKRLKTGKDKFSFKAEIPKKVFSKNLYKKQYVKISVKRHYVKDVDENDFAIKGDIFPDEIRLWIITAPKVDIKPMLSEIIFGLKETLRHEVEHLTQYWNVNKPEIELDTELPEFEYHTAKHEVPAFVQGLYKRAKMKKQPLDKVIEKYLELIVKGGALTKSQAKQVKELWFDYAKRNLPSARWSS